MPNSLKCMLKKLHHKGQITDAEYEELISKLSGHDRELINKVCSILIKCGVPFNADANYEILQLKERS